jgi:hypothetical protein
MPTRSPFPGVRAPLDDVDHLRKGTRDQYTSRWVKILDGLSHEFLHELGEIPWTVSVNRSESDEGKQAVEATIGSGLDITITKTDTTITVTNNTGIEDFSTYFQVRAL